MSRYTLFDNYEIKFTIDFDPAGSTWIAGLGVSEESLKWRDFDYGLRSSNGVLTVYENAKWRATGPELVQGDVISIFVDAGSLEYRLNGNAMHTSSYSGTPDFYIDSSFRSGQAILSVTAVRGGVAEPDPLPMLEWANQAGGVSVVGDGLEYSGTNWRDVDFGFRSSNGLLRIYENGGLRNYLPALVA